MKLFNEDYAVFMGKVVTALAMKGAVEIEKADLYCITPQHKLTFTESLDGRRIQIGVINPAVEIRVVGASQMEVPMRPPAHAEPAQFVSVTKSPEELRQREEELAREKILREEMRTRGPMAVNFGS